MNWIETVNTYLPALKFVTAFVVPFVIPIFAEVFPQRFSADLRCKLWLLALFAMCAAPFVCRIDVKWPIAVKPLSQAFTPVTDRKYESKHADFARSFTTLDGQSDTALHQAPVILAENSESTNAIEGQTNPAFNINQTFSLFNLYVAVVCILLYRVLNMHWRAFLIRSRGEPVGNAGSHSLLQEWSRQNSITIRTSGDIRVPTVVGIVRPEILLPKDTANWPAEKLMAVVQHESAHISRRDILWTTIAFVLRAAFWINPMAWIAVERITRLRELACDDIASKQASSVFSYAEHLIAIAREIRVGRENCPLTASTASAVQQTELKLRLRHVLDARQNRAPSSVRSMLVFAAVIGSLAAFCGVFLPSSITATLMALEAPPTTKTTQGAVLFSGQVKDVRGNPIAGVRVSLGAWNIKLSEQDRLASETTTNGDGVFEWRTPMVYRINLTKLGYIGQQIEVTGPKERQIVLQDAFKIRGVVLGPDSKPVAGAKVSAFTEADIAQPPRTVLTTDAKGNFEFANASKSIINVAAIDEDGYAGTLANARSTNSNNIIQILPPKSITIKVKDHAGAPVPDADIILASWNKNGALRFTDKTNSDGEFVWPKAPSGTLVLAARRQGFRTAWEILDTETSPTAEMTLYPPLEFSCTAVDSETGESITDFIVTRRYERKVSGKLEDEKFPQGSLPEKFRNRGTIGDRTQDGSLRFVSDYAFDRMTLNIHADGYQVLKDTIDSGAEVSPRRNYRLTKVKKDTTKEIQITGPDGRPAANVNVQVQIPGLESLLRTDPVDFPLENLDNPWAVLKTDSDGKFVLPADRKEGAIAAWGDSGWFFESLNNIDLTIPIVLEPYSRVRIRLPLSMRENRQTSFVLKKHLEVPLRRNPISNAIWIKVNPTESDLPDEIVVERALGGTVSLVDTSRRFNQRLFTEHVVASFEVDPGTETVIDLTGTSKISGRLSLPPEAKVRLEQLEIRASTRGKDHTKAYRSFVQSDGYFEFDEISDGDYTFSIPSIEIEPQEGMPRPSAYGQSGYNIASLKLGIDLQVVVAEGQTRDLGVVETRVLMQR